MKDKLEGFEQYDEVSIKYLRNIMSEKTKDILKRKLSRENLEEYSIKHKGNIYVNKKYISEWFKLNSNIIEFEYALEIIKNELIDKLNYETEIIKLSRLLKEKVEVFNVYLFNKEIRAINKDKFELILEGIDYIKISDCINAKELVEKVNSKYKGLKFGITEKNIFNFIRDNKLKVFNSNFIGNFYTNKMNLYPKETAEKVYNNIKDVIINGKISLINMSFEEYFSLTDEDFSKFRILNDYEKNAITDIVKNVVFNDLHRTFKYTDVKVIFVRNVNVYVSIKEFQEFENFKNNYIDVNNFEEEGLKFRRKMAENNGIEVRYYKDKLYIKKSDIDKYSTLYNSKRLFTEAETIYDKFLIKIKYGPNKNERSYPKFMAYLLEFVKFINKTNKTHVPVFSLYGMYNQILDSIKVDLEPNNKEENNKLFTKVIRKSYIQKNLRSITLQFIKFLIKNKNFKLNNIYDVREKNSLQPYEKEQFITLLAKLIEVVGDKDKLKKTYRDWNLSSIITYIFMHYCLAWRKTDLTSKLPDPNLKMIEGVTDGESFIKWLEAGNEINDALAYDICKSIEEATNRLRKISSKNEVTLCCVISEVFYKEVATLLCINKANREIHMKIKSKARKNNSIFNNRYLEHTNMNPLLIENFNIDLEEILGDGFHNIRMNKGFMSLVKEKAEELNLAYSYYYAQVSRGHVADDGALAETTKIYLQKDISKASVMAFSTGTMGSIAYTLLELIDKEFKNKSDNDKVNAIQNLNMTPYTIENNVKIISNKISVVKREINQYFIKGGYKNNLLKEILYSQNSYGIENRTKCLVKITRDGEVGINRIKSKNYNDKFHSTKWCPFNKKSCIGCDYMIALRYFIYEFDLKFNHVLNDLEFAETKIDKEIAISSINELYLPVLNDLAIILGDEVHQIIDTNRYLRLAESVEE